MMRGPVTGGSVQLAPAAPKMAVSEGIESGLSFQQLYGIPTWAALSTSGTTGLVLPDLPLAQEICIAADNDKAGREAAYKAAEKWTKEGRKVRIIFPPLQFNDFNNLLMDNNNEKPENCKHS